MVSPANIRKTAAALQLSIGLLKRRAREKARDGELSGPETAVLSRLDRNGPGTTAALARWEQITPQAMGATVAALEARELIIRAPDPDDGRRSILRLTGAGERALRAGRNALTDQMAAALSRGFTPGEIEQLRVAAPLIERLAQLI
jgi:DNA-binding MarR family transcriptional regulator